MEREQFVDFLNREYVREYLKPEGESQEKLEFLDKMIESIDPITLPHRFDRDVFCQNLLRRIDDSEKQQRNDLMKKAAIIVILMGFGGNIVCEAATGKSIFHYIENAATEFRIRISDDQSKKSTSQETAIKEDVVEEFTESEVSSWNAAIRQTKWEFRYVKEPLFQLERTRISLLKEGKEVTSITAEYEGTKGTYYTYMVDHYEDEVGTNDFSLSDDAKKIETQIIGNMEVIYYQEEAGIVAVGMEQHNIYQIISNDSYAHVKEVVENLQSNME